MEDKPESPMKKMEEDIARLMASTGASVEEVAKLLRPDLPFTKVPLGAQLSAETWRPPERLNLAEWAYERLISYIKDFEAELDGEHEIGAHLVSFGSAVTFHIEDLGYFGPDIITFYGQDQHGQKVQLIQNISQLSVLLVALKKLGEKPRRLGFQLEQRHAEDQGDE